MAPPQSIVMSIMRARGGKALYSILAEHMGRRDIMDRIVSACDMLYWGRELDWKGWHCACWNSMLIGHCWCCKNDFCSQNMLCVLTSF